LGSTVIVLFARGAVQWNPRLVNGVGIAMGTALGYAATGASAAR
jgi:hypothetical protein